MEILDNTLKASNKFKINLFLNLILIVLFSLGIKNLFNIENELVEARLWIESFSNSGLGGGFCGTGLLDKAYHYKMITFNYCLIGGIISMIILRNNKWKISKSIFENIILFSPLILISINHLYPTKLF